VPPDASNDPLAAVLVRAADRTDHPGVRAWLLALLDRGTAANETVNQKTQATRTQTGMLLR
jgi:hypothetical protein